MVLRCTLDALLLPAHPNGDGTALVAWDGGESFEVEAVEAIYYEIVCATPGELLWLERAKYRLLRRAADFAASRWSGPRRP